MDHTNGAAGTGRGEANGGRRGGADERIAEAGSPRAIALAVVVLLPLYLGLALAYRDAVPLFEAPDEPSHLHYALFVYHEGRLPGHGPPEVPGEGTEPPLVYAVAAPLLGATDLDADRALEALSSVGRRLYQGANDAPPHPALAVDPGGSRLFMTDGSLAELRRLRGASLAFGMLAVLFTFAAVWRVGRDARLALLAASLLAFDPQFLFTSAHLSNDTAAAAVGAATLWLVLLAFEEGGPSRVHYLAGALLIGLGLLTKLSTLPGLAVAAGAIVMIDSRPERDRRADLAFAGALVLLLTTPWLVWSLDQRDHLLGVAAVSGAGLPVPHPEDVGGRLAWFGRVYWDWTFESYWARFGWLDLRAPQWVYYAFFALTWTGLLGFYSGRVAEANALLRDRRLRAYLLLTVASTLVVHLGANLFVPSPDGTDLYAAAPHFSLVLALGLGRLLGHEHRTLPITIGTVASLVILAVYCLRGVLIPAYTG